MDGNYGCLVLVLSFMIAVLIRTLLNTTACRYCREIFVAIFNNQVKSLVQTEKPDAARCFEAGSTVQ